MVETMSERVAGEGIIEWLVLSKAPLAGRVKTRLIPALGEQGAYDVYVQLLMRLQVTLNRMVSNPRLPSQVALWISGDTEHEAFNAWADFSTVYVQPEQGDLGERMALAVMSSLARGCIPVLIGVDVPDLDEAYLTHCLQQLQSCDVVISPAEDGGYGLLGMKQFHAELFANKLWGTDSVFNETRNDLHRLDVAVAYLPQVWDVDELCDVERFRLIQS